MFGDILYGGLEKWLGIGNASEGAWESTFSLSFLLDMSSNSHDLIEVIDGVGIEYGPYSGTCLDA